MAYQNTFDEILEILGEPACLAQMASACADVTSAALKLQWTLEGNSPESKVKEARQEYMEALAGFFLCYRVLPEVDENEIVKMRLEKMLDWYRRVKKKSLRDKRRKEEREARR